MKKKTKIKEQNEKDNSEVFKIKDIFNLKNKINIFYLMILFLPLIDLFTALQTRFIDFPITIGVIIKGILLAYIIYFMLFKLKNKYRKTIIYYLVAVMLFWILYIVTKSDINGLNNLLKEVSNLFKFSFYPILVIGLIELDNEQIIDRNKITYILSYSLIGYVIFILIPYLTGTGFKSYGILDIENGTTGWFYAANEIGSILTILIVFTYKHLDKEKYLLFIVTALALAFVSFEIGTKVASIGVLIIIIMMLIYYSLLRSNNKNKKIILCIILLLLSLYCFTKSPTLGNMNTTYTRYGEVNIEPDDNFEIVPKSKIETFAISLLSGRERFLFRVKESFDHATVTDKLFGIGFTERESHYSRHASRLIEMDYFDVYFRFGIIGFIIFIIPFVIIIFDIINKLIKKHYKFTLEFFKYFIVWLMITCIGFLAGHVIGSPAVSFYLGIVLLLMYRSLKEV